MRVKTLQKFLFLHGSQVTIRSICHPLLTLKLFSLRRGQQPQETAVPTQECKHQCSFSKNLRLRTFLECPNRPPLLCLQFHTDGNPAISAGSVSLSGLLRGQKQFGGISFSITAHSDHFRAHRGILSRGKGGKKDRDKMQNCCKALLIWRALGKKLHAEKSVNHLTCSGCREKTKKWL